MGRRKKGRPVDGWLIIDKPLGVGSTEVVSRARWALNARKAGHAGTLDPLATGLLAVAFGEATKTVPVASDGLKTYRFSVRWGIRTASDDAETAPIATSDLRPDRAAIEAALPAFRGDIMQAPPQFSAVKVDGERAYDLARDGETMALAARPLHMARLELAAMPDADHAEFEMVCGKGGYVRSIARDLGEALGCGAHVSALRRTAAGPFDVSEAAVPYETLESYRDRPEALPLLPVSAGLRELPEVRVGALAAADLRMGREGAATHAPADLAWGDPAWASCAGEAVAIGTWAGGRLKPNRVILPPEVGADPTG
ncbi:MAG: tRNA pseudouridine(55) synthase TruB [Pseudomonadota bacterium]|nr:tRNA pseudouridine(55) synthase TruB [Pseudomonadota bacterium]MEE3099622.1 tRNA pseudouridine(55) synthase TruB [Pseudomonadota bacterium]